MAFSFLTQEIAMDLGTANTVITFFGLSFTKCLFPLIRLLDT